MNCPIERDDHEVMLEYCRGRLSAEEALAFERHLAGCPDCTRVVAAQLAVWTELDLLHPAPVAATFDQRLYARIAREEQRNPLVKWWRMVSARWMPLSWRPVVPVAAMCAMLTVAVLVQRPVSLPPTQSGEAQVKMEMTELEQVERALDDLDLLHNLGSDSGNLPPSAM